MDGISVYSSLTNATLRGETVEFMFSGGRLGLECLRRFDVVGIDILSVFSDTVDVNGTPRPLFDLFVACSETLRTMLKHRLERGRPHLRVS
jgi:hypothetical protein